MIDALTPAALDKLIAECSESKVFTPIIRAVGRVFSSPDLVIESFRKVLSFSCMLSLG